MHTKPAKEVGHVEAGDRAVGGDMECDDFRSKERREDSWLVEDISTGGGSSRGREGAHGDEARRDRRERREPQGKAGVVHDDQSTTDMWHFKKLSIKFGDVGGSELNEEEWGDATVAE